MMMVSTETMMQIRDLINEIEGPHTHPEGMNECSICDEQIIDAALRHLKIYALMMLEEKEITEFFLPQKTCTHDWAGADSVAKGAEFCRKCYKFREGSDDSKED
jgi:hypothetical protein